MDIEESFLSALAKPSTWFLFEGYCAKNGVSLETQHEVLFLVYVRKYSHSQSLPDRVAIGLDICNSFLVQAAPKRLEFPAQQHFALMTVVESLQMDLKHNKRDSFEDSQFFASLAFGVSKALFDNPAALTTESTDHAATNEQQQSRAPSLPESFMQSKEYLNHVREEKLYFGLAHLRNARPEHAPPYEHPVVVLNCNAKFFSPPSPSRATNELGGAVGATSHEESNEMRSRSTSTSSAKEGSRESARDSSREGKAATSGASSTSPPTTSSFLDAAKPHGTLSSSTSNAATPNATPERRLRRTSDTKKYNLPVLTIPDGERVRDESSNTQRLLSNDELDDALDEQSKLLPQRQRERSRSGGRSGELPSLVVPHAKDSLGSQQLQPAPPTASTSSHDGGSPSGKNSKQSLSSSSKVKNRKSSSEAASGLSDQSPKNRGSSGNRDSAALSSSSKSARNKRGGSDSHADSGEKERRKSDSARASNATVKPGSAASSSSGGSSNVNGNSLSAGINPAAFSSSNGSSVTPSSSLIARVVGQSLMTMESSLSATSASTPTSPTVASAKQSSGSSTAPNEMTATELETSAFELSEKVKRQTLARAIADCAPALISPTAFNISDTVFRDFEIRLRDDTAGPASFETSLIAVLRESEGTIPDRSKLRLYGKLPYASTKAQLRFAEKASSIVLNFVLECNDSNVTSKFGAATEKILLFVTKPKNFQVTHPKYFILTMGPTGCADFTIRCGEIEHTEALLRGTYTQLIQHKILKFLEKDLRLPVTGLRELKVKKKSVAKFHEEVMNLEKRVLAGFRVQNITIGLVPRSHNERTIEELSNNKTISPALEHFMQLMRNQETRAAVRKDLNDSLNFTSPFDISAQLSEHWNSANSGHASQSGPLSPTATTDAAISSHNGTSKEKLFSSKRTISRHSQSHATTSATTTNAGTTSSHSDSIGVASANSASNSLSSPHVIPHATSVSSLVGMKKRASTGKSEKRLHRHSTDGHETHEPNEKDTKKQQPISSNQVVTSSGSSTSLYTPSPSTSDNAIPPVLSPAKSSSFSNSAPNSPRSVDQLKVRFTASPTATTTAGTGSGTATPLAPMQNSAGSTGSSSKPDAATFSSSGGATGKTARSLRKHTPIDLSEVLGDVRANLVLSNVEVETATTPTSTSATTPTSTGPSTPIIAATREKSAVPSLELEKPMQLQQLRQQQALKPSNVPRPDSDSFTFEDNDDASNNLNAGETANVFGEEYEDEFFLSPRPKNNPEPSATALSATNYNNNSKAVLSRNSSTSNPSPQLSPSTSSGGTPNALANPSPQSGPPRKIRRQAGAIDLLAELGGSSGKAGFEQVAESHVLAHELQLNLPLDRLALSDPHRTHSQDSSQSATTEREQALGLASPKTPKTPKTPHRWSVAHVTANAVENEPAVPDELAVNTTSDLPERFNVDWNGIDVQWSVGPKMTRELFRSFVGNSGVLIIFDESPINEPFNPVDLFLGKVTHFVVVIKPILDAVTGEYSYRIGSFIHYEQKWNATNHTHEDTNAYLRWKLKEIQIGPTLPRDFQIEQCHVQSLVMVLLHNAMVAANQSHSQIRRLTIFPLNSAIGEVIKKYEA